jgi:hypothetical protein
LICGATEESNAQIAAPTESIDWVLFLPIRNNPSIFLFP